MRCSANVAITSAASTTPTAMSAAITNRGGDTAKRPRVLAAPSPTTTPASTPVIAARGNDGGADRGIWSRLPNEILQNAGVHAGLRRFLVDAGASERDIERADAEGWLPLLTFDRLIAPGPARHDAAAVAALAGCS